MQDSVSIHWSDEPLNDTMCTACSLHKTANCVGIQWRGSPNPELLVVGIAPGATEDEQGKNFVGNSGQFLRRALSEAGIDLDTVAYTNLVQCVPWDDPNAPWNGVRDPSPEEVFACQPRLLREIVHLQPKAILTLGGIPGHFFLGEPGSKRTTFKITQHRGKVSHAKIAGRSYPVIPALHPAAILRSPQSEPQFINDLRVAKRVVDGIYSEGLPETIVARDTSHALQMIAECKAAYERGETKHVSFDLECTSFFPWDEHARILGIALAHGPGKGYYIPVDHHGVGRVPVESLPRYTYLDRDKVISAFKDLVQTVPVSNQNIKFDLVWIKHLWDIEPCQVYADPLIMSHLLLGELRDRQNSLKVLARDFLGYPEYERALRDYLADIDSEDYSLVPLEVMSPYAGVDAEASWRLVELFMPHIEREGMIIPFQLSTAASLTFSDIEVSGVAVDLSTLDSIRNEYTHRMRKTFKDLLLDPQVQLHLDLAEVSNTVAAQDPSASKSKKAKARVAAWRDALENLYPTDAPLPDLIKAVGFNPNSSTTVASVLYDGYGVPVSEEWITESKNRSVKDSVLKEIDAMLGEDHEARGFLSKIISFRGDKKILSSYLDTLPSYVRDDGTLQVKYLITGTFTGRLSTRDFALHTMPKEGKSPLKKAFVSRWRDPAQDALSRLKTKRLPSWAEEYPEKGGGLFVAMDYEQLELKILASCSGDKNMIQAFIDGKDLHKFVASKIFYPPAQKLLQQDPRKLWKNHSYFMSVPAYVEALRSLNLQVLLEQPFEKKVDKKTKKLDHSEIHPNLVSQVDLALQVMAAHFSVHPEEYESIRFSAVVKSQRSMAKGISFGLVYGQSPAAMARKAEDMTEEEAYALIDDYFLLFPDVKVWIDAQHAAVTVPREIWAGNGTILTYSNWSPVGRVRHFPKAGSSERGERNAAARGAQNFPIQSGASELAVAGLQKAEQALATAGCRSRVNGMVHDAVYFDVFPGELLTVLPLAKKALERDVVETPAFKWADKAPLRVDMEVGASCGTCVAVKKVREDGLVVIGPPEDVRSTLALMDRSYRINELSSKEEVTPDGPRMTMDLQLQKLHIPIWSLDS